MTDLLSDTPQLNSIISFLPTTGMANPITGIHLHYLKASDCYSGYAGGFYSRRGSDVYLTSETMPFMLDGKGVYFVGASVIRSAKLSDIHSVLIRLVSEDRGTPKPRFAYFIGDCEDQDINCCIPITCSDEEEICLPQNPFPVQYIFWR